MQRETVARLSAVRHNRKPPGVGALGRFELNQAGAWAKQDGVLCVPYFAQPDASVNAELCL